MTKASDEKEATRKALEVAAAFAAASGVTLDIDSMMSDYRTKAEAEREKAEFRNAVETLLNREHYKHSTMTKRCRNCKASFITTYCYHWYCSDLCATEDFKRHFGIDPHRLNVPRLENPAWEHELVGAVPSIFTKWLYEYAKWIVLQVESLTQEQQENLSDDFPDSDENLVVTDSSPLDLSEQDPLVLDISSEESDAKDQATPLLLLDIPDFQV